MILELITGAMLAAAAVTQAPLEQQQQAPGSAPSPAPVSDKPVQSPSKPTSIPFELRDNLVNIDTVVNGRKHRAVLDSGAGAMLASRDFARDMGLSEGQSAGDAAGGGEQAKTLRTLDFSSLAVGPLRFEHVPGYTANLDQLSSSSGFPINLLIGAPAFKYGAVTVDYQRRRVTWGPSGSSGKCAAPIPLTIVHEVPVVEVEVRPTPDSAPVRLKLVVDLGTRHQAMFIGGQFVRSEAGQALMRSGVAKQVGHGIGGAVQGSVARVAELRLGQSRIANLEVALTAGVSAFEVAGIDGSLGVPIWKDGAITFDYPAKVLCIESKRG